MIYFDGQPNANLPVTFQNLFNHDSFFLCLTIIFILFIQRVFCYKRASEQHLHSAYTWWMDTVLELHLSHSQNTKIARHWQHLEQNCMHIWMRKARSVLLSGSFSYWEGLGEWNRPMILHTMTMNPIKIHSKQKQEVNATKYSDEYDVEF
jgi:hypothetical protein